MISEASLKMLERMIEKVRLDEEAAQLGGCSSRIKLATAAMCLLPELIAEARKLRAVRKALGVSS